MDGDGVSLAVGSGAVGAICGVVIAWIKAKWGTKAKVEPTPLPVETHRVEEYVTKETFQKHVAENHEREDANRREHEALYSRMNRNDRETSEIKGLLSAIREDIQLIKTKLFKGGK